VKVNAGMVMVSGIGFNVRAKVHRDAVAGVRITRLQLEFAGNAWGGCIDSPWMLLNNFLFEYLPSNMILIREPFENLQKHKALSARV
jgi:hypothetical protein